MIFSHFIEPKKVVPKIAEDIFYSSHDFYSRHTKTIQLLNTVFTKTAGVNLCRKDRIFVHLRKKQR